MKEIDIIIMSGQSNMQGQSEGPARSCCPPGTAWEYKYLTNTLLPVCHPSGEDIAADGEMLLLGAHQGYGSLLPEFARAYFETGGRLSCLVHCAKGATAICEWQPETARYQMLVQKARAAADCLTQNGFRIGRRIFVWLQGESDGIAGTSQEEYTRLLLNFHSALKRDLTIERFGIIRIAKFGDYPCLPIMAAQEEVCRSVEGFAMLTRAAGTFTVENGLMQGETAPDHYTNAGYDYLGRLAGARAAGLWNGEPVPPEPEPYPELLPVLAQ